MACLGNNFSGNQGLLRELFRYIGETVTIFTTSGGASGCGFTGVIISVNCNFVRLVTHQGTPPTNPLAENICGDMDDGGCGGLGGIGGGKLGNVGGIGGGKPQPHMFTVGSVVDIPVDRIAAFVHNAV